MAALTEKQRIGLVALGVVAVCAWIIAHGLVVIAHVVPSIWALVSEPLPR